RPTPTGIGVRSLVGEREALMPGAEMNMRISETGSLTTLLLLAAAACMSGLVGCRSAMDDFFWPLVDVDVDVNGHGEARCSITEGDRASGPDDSNGREREQRQRNGHRPRLPHHDRCLEENR